jgi:hypothetical protein
MSRGGGCKQGCSGFVIASLAVVAHFNGTSSVLLVLCVLGGAVCGPVDKIAVQLVIVKGDQKVYAPDDYSTKNTQKYFKQFQSLTIIT